MLLRNLIYTGITQVRADAGAAGGAEEGAGHGGAAQAAVRRWSKLGDWPAMAGAQGRDPDPRQGARRQLLLPGGCRRAQGVRLTAGGRCFTATSPCGLSCSLQSVVDGDRVLPAVEDGVDADRLALHSIVDGERESPGEQAMVPEMPRVDASRELQGINVGEQGVEEVAAETRFLSFVEAVAVKQILFCFVEDLHSHATRA